MNVTEDLAGEERAQMKKEGMTDGGREKKKKCVWMFASGVRVRVRMSVFGRNCVRVRVRA